MTDKFQSTSVHLENDRNPNKMQIIERGNGGDWKVGDVRDFDDGPWRVTKVEPTNYAR